MFHPDDLGMSVFRRSYAFDDKETWGMAAMRVADHVAAAEDSGKRNEWFNRFRA